MLRGVNSVKTGDWNRGISVFGFGKPEPRTRSRLTGVLITGWFRFVPGPVTDFLRKLIDDEKNSRFNCKTEIKQLSTH
jgi:hypothetical protein